MHDHDIGDVNVERLLGTAYNPEAVDPAFVKQIEEEMCAAALAGCQAQILPKEEPGQRIIRRRLGWAMALAASVAACFLVYYARTHRVGPVLPPNMLTQDVPRVRPAALGDN